MNGPVSDGARADARGVSTVVDATLFVLILGVAVATIVAVPIIAEDPTDRADAIAESLATGTDRVEYSLAPAARSLPGDPPTSIADGPPFDRSAHGTPASLLADAAVASVAYDGERIAGNGADFAAAVGTATENWTRRRNVSVSVRARWEPYPGASITGETHAGDRPPATADLNAATVTVDGPMPAGRDAAMAVASERGYAGVADVVANATVTGLFPPERARLALRGEYPVDALVAHRYVRASATFADDRLDPAAGMNVSRANAHLREGLADRIERDLRNRFATPAAAAGNVTTGTVTITVRTWSR